MCLYGFPMLKENEVNTIDNCISIIFNSFMLHTMECPLDRVITTKTWLLWFYRGKAMLE